MKEAEFFEHYCGGYQCDQPGVIPITTPLGLVFGHYCEDHADDFAREMRRFSEQNQLRLEVPR